MKIFLIEDNIDHRALMIHALSVYDAAWQIQGAANGEEALRRLAQETFDLVCLDYSLPGSDGLEVLQAIRHRHGPPVVVVTGRGDEQVAVNAIQAGAYDYVVKQEGYLQRLPVVVQRAVEAHQLAVERQRAEEALRQSEERFAKAFQANPDSAAITRLHDGCFVDINAGFERFTGYRRTEIIGHLASETGMWVRPEDRARYIALLRQHGRVKDFETIFRTKSGALRTTMLSAEIIELHGVPHAMTTVHDITERKQTEEALRQYAARLRLLYEIAQGTLLAQPLEEIIGGTLRHMRHLVPCEVAGVGLFDFERQQVLVFAANRDGETRTCEGTRMALEVYDDLDILRQGRVYIVEDILALSPLSPALQRLLAAGVRSYMRVPLMSQGALIGSLNLRRAHPGAFAPEHVDIACEVGGQMAVALQQSRLHAEVQRRFQELTAVYQASQRLQQLSLPSTLAPQVIQVLAETVGYEYGAVVLTEEATGRLIPFALSSQGRDPAFAEADRAYVMSHNLRLGVGITGWVAQHGHSVRLGDVRQDPRYYAVRDDTRSELCVPLRLGEHIMGVVNVESPKLHAYTEADQRLLETVANQIAIAIQNAQLFAQVQENGARLQALSRRLVELQEVERRALARELHDEIGQLLTGLKLLLDMSTGVPEAALRANLHEAQALAQTMLEQVRNLSLDLRPAMLDDLGLLPALLWQCERFTAQTQVQVTVRHSGMERRFPPDIETAVYRIAQESLTNVARHAGVHEATVRLWADQDGMGVQIEDHGAGFDPDTLCTARVSSGLSGMRERVRLLGGELTIEAAPGVGTRVLAEFPLSRQLEGECSAG